MSVSLRLVMISSTLFIAATSCGMLENVSSSLELSCDDIEDEEDDDTDELLRGSCCRNWWTRGWKFVLVGSLSSDGRRRCGLFMRI